MIFSAVLCSFSTTQTPDQLHLVACGMRQLPSSTCETRNAAETGRNWTATLSPTDFIELIVLPMTTISFGVQNIGKTAIDNF